MCLDYKYFGQHDEIFMKKIHVLGTNTDPDPAK
jgi:hypothetical protein